MSSKCCNRGVISHTFPNGQQHNMCPKCRMSWYDTAATPAQIKLIKSLGTMVLPGLTKKQAGSMLNQYKQDTCQKKMAAMQKPKKVKFKPIGVLPKKPSTIGAFPHKAEPAPPKEEPPVVAGPTGRRIKEID